jgi:hypothetical protein
VYVITAIINLVNLSVATAEIIKKYEFEYALVRSLAFRASPNLTAADIIEIGTSVVVGVGNESYD